jgi:2-phosphosulfolactate phosphatase
MKGLNPMSKGTVVIDCFLESVEFYRQDYAVVAVDVIRATTSIVTAAAMGRRCFAVASLEAAMSLAANLEQPLLVGEVAGAMPKEFHMNNSPAELALRTDLVRPMIVLSSSGTKLICEARKCSATYLACFRNYGSTAAHLAEHHSRVAIIGAGTRGEFREEDQMCCAWIAEHLLKSDFEAQDKRTLEVLERWRGAPPEACTSGRSAAYLRQSGQLRDLEFVLGHIDDIEDVLVVQDGQIMVIAAEAAVARQMSGNRFIGRDVHR